MQKFIRIIGVVGRVLVVLGLVLLYYTGYLLWGTSIQTNQAQAELEAELRQSHDAAAVEQLEAGEIPVARPAGEIKLGDPLFQIVIPKIGLHKTVVSGVGDQELKAGPGHFPDAPYPGEKGNVPVSGHRTTYGAPFYRLDELDVGDELFLERDGVRYKYRMDEEQIVRPTQTEVVDDRGRDELTLTTCHPRYSAAQRLIIHAAFVGAEKVPPPPTAGGGSADLSTVSNLNPKTTSLPADVIVLSVIALALLLTSLGMTPRFRRVAYTSGLTVVAAAGMWIYAFPEILKLLPAEF